MKHHSQRSSKEVRKNSKHSFSNKHKGPLRNAMDDASIVILTRSIEVFAVLSSLLWAVETAAQDCTSEDLPRSPASANMGRSLSSLGIPNKTSNVAEVEFLQYSHLTEVFQTKFQPLPLTLTPENPALSFKQSPFFVQAQIEFIRFPTFWKK